MSEEREKERKERQRKERQRKERERRDHRSQKERQRKREREKKERERKEREKRAREREREVDSLERCLLSSAQTHRWQRWRRIAWLCLAEIHTAVRSQSTVSPAGMPRSRHC